MFVGIHEISIIFLGTLPENYQLLYFISDFFLLTIIMITLLSIILFPLKLLRGW